MRLSSQPALGQPNPNARSSDPGDEPTSLARPEDTYAFDRSKDNKVPVSRYDGIAMGNDCGRQDMSISWISESGELARTSCVSSAGNNFYTKQREDFPGLLSSAGELLLHDLQDFVLNILRDDESMFSAERG